MPPALDAVLAALHRSHDRLAETIGALSTSQLTGPSYADDWTVAQVCSHLGSGAEVFGLHLDAGLSGSPMMSDTSQAQPIWDRWNALPPTDQATEALTADATLLGRVDALTVEERDSWRLQMWGTEQTIAGLALMRLAEHALHTWDIAVSVDPSATLEAETAGLLLGYLPFLAQYAAKPTPDEVVVDVTTQDPTRRLTLSLGAAPSLADEPSDGAATLALPAEAFVRLVYGRLDPEHTPESMVARGVDLEVLRAIFGGI